MNATTINNNTPEKTTIKVKKVRGPYGPRKPKALVVEEEDEITQTEPVVEPIPDDDKRSLCEEDLQEFVVESDSESEKGEDDDEEEEKDEEEEDEDTRSTLSSIAEEQEEEEETTTAVVAVEEADGEADEEADDLELPVLESDPILLREQILNLQAEVIRLTKFNQDLQRRLEGERKQPKKKAEKEAKAKKEGKRENKRAKRPSDYAEKYLKRGQVLRWEHKARKAWGEATYIGNNSFTAKFSFKPEGEHPEEFPSLNAVAGVMLKHLTLRSLNAWSAFKTLDGKSVENLDLQAKA
jgi:hypothetical protein